jgi:hypothetical protein
MSSSVREHEGMTAPTNRPPGRGLSEDTETASLTLLGIEHGESLGVPSRGHERLPENVLTSRGGVHSPEERRLP